jgi:hypothetical protein
MAEDYSARNVALVAIQPNSPKSVRLDEMGYTDAGDSFEDMKVRAEYRQFNFPYLYDGETQKVSQAYGPAATPHLFIFDAERKLRYQGRIDNNPRETLVTSRDARNAIDAILEGKSVPVAKTPSVGCSTKWLYRKKDEKKNSRKLKRSRYSFRPRRRSRPKSAQKQRSGNYCWSIWARGAVPDGNARVSDHLSHVQPPRPSMWRP